MPTLLCWKYKGGGEGSDANVAGEQRVYPGDPVEDDILGDGIAVRVDGGDINIE